MTLFIKCTIAITFIAVTSAAAAPTSPDTEFSNSTMTGAGDSNEITKTHSYAGKKRKAVTDPSAENPLKIKKMGNYRTTKAEFEAAELDAADFQDIEMADLDTEIAPVSPVIERKQEEPEYDSYAEDIDVDLLCIGFESAFSLSSNVPTPQSDEDDFFGEQLDGDTFENGYSCGYSIDF